MGTQALLTIVCWLTLSQALEETKKTVNSLVVTDNISEESAPRLYRSAPAGVYASAIPYASFSFNVPKFVLAPKAASSQNVPVKAEAGIKNAQGYLKDSYGNKFVGSPQTMAYKATLPQQFLQLQDLPAHLSQPLVAPSFQVPHYFYGSPYKLSSFQAATPTPLRFGGFSQPLVYAEKLKSVASSPFHNRAYGTPQQQPSNKKATYANSPGYTGYYKTFEPQFQRLQHKNVVYGYNFGHTENQYQPQQKNKNEKIQPETAQAKQTIVTTLADGKQAVIQLDTKPPVPLLDLTLLEPLTFANPIVPQVQHFLPKINSVIYQKLPELDDIEQVKKHKKEFVVQNTKSYDSREKPQVDGSIQQKKPPPPQEVIIHHEKTHNVQPTVTIEGNPNDGNEFSYEIQSPTYKETYNEQVLKYNKETKPEPVHYSYNMKTDNEPVTYSFAHVSQDPAQLKQASYQDDPKHLIYTFTPEEHITETDEDPRPSTRAEVDSSRESKEPEVLVHILENDDQPEKAEIIKESVELGNDPDVRVQIIGNSKQHRDAPRPDYHERPEHREEEYIRQPKQEIRHDSDSHRPVKSHKHEAEEDSEQFYHPRSNPETRHDSEHHSPSRPSHDDDDDDDYRPGNNQEIRHKSERPEIFIPNGSSKPNYHDEKEDYHPRSNQDDRHNPAPYKSSKSYHQDDEEDYRPHSNQEKIHHNSDHNRSPKSHHHDDKEDYHHHANQELRHNSEHHKPTGSKQVDEDKYYPPSQDIRYDSKYDKSAPPNHKNNDDEDYQPHTKQEIRHESEHNRPARPQHYHASDHSGEEIRHEPKKKINHESKNHHLKNLDGDKHEEHHRRPNQEINKDVENFRSPKHYSQSIEVPIKNFQPQIEVATHEYEEDIRIIPVQKSHAPIKVDPSQHIQSSSGENHEDSPSQSSENNTDEDSDHQSINNPPHPRPSPPVPQHILEKSKSIIIHEETPDEMHTLREQMVAEMIKEGENNEDEFEKSYKNSAYGFPAFENKASEEEKEIYNPQTYGVARHTDEFEVDDTPFKNYHDEADSYPRSSRLTYKDVRDKRKDDYYSEFAVSKPESDKERYEKKEDYYKTYMKYRPEKLFAKEHDEKEQRSEKYTALPTYEYKPLQEKKKKPYFAEYKAVPQRYAYAYPKETSHDNKAHDSRPYQSFASKTQFVEPQFQYGFEPITIPRLLDSELAAMASNDSPESETPGTRKKIYKENWYIKKTSTGNNAAS